MGQDSLSTCDSHVKKVWKQEGRVEDHIRQKTHPSNRKQGGDFRPLIQKHTQVNQPGWDRGRLSLCVLLTGTNSREQNQILVLGGGNKLMVESFFLHASSSCLYPSATLQPLSIVILHNKSTNVSEFCVIFDDAMIHGSEFPRAWSISEPLKVPHLLTCP